MSSFLPSVAYPPAGPGYWDPVTSTLDWCEENYYASHYVAEVVNTITNLFFIYLGIRGIRNCLREGHDTVFVVAFVAYLLIGIGSFCFHATLTHSMQLVDEISMIYTTTVLVYASYSHTKSSLLKVVVAVLTFGLAAAITLIYFYLGDPVFHQASFFIFTLSLVIRGVYLMEVRLRPRWRKVLAAMDGRPERWTNGHGAVVRAQGEFEVQEAQDREDEVLLKRMYALMGYGLFTGLSAFFIWNMDNIHCGRIRSWRREVLGLPWGILLEGHGWWHIMTGIAGYINVVWNTWMRYALYGRQNEVELVWPSTMFSIPEVVKKRVQKKTQ